MKRRSKISSMFMLIPISYYYQATNIICALQKLRRMLYVHEFQMLVYVKVYYIFILLHGRCDGIYMYESINIYSIIRFIIIIISTICYSSIKRNEEILWCLCTDRKISQICIFFYQKLSSEKNALAFL